MPLWKTRAWPEFGVLFLEQEGNIREGNTTGVVIKDKKAAGDGAAHARVCPLSHLAQAGEVAQPSRTFLAATDGSRAKKTLAVAHTKEIRIKLRSLLNYNHQFIILISCQARVNRPTFSCEQKLSLEFHHLPTAPPLFGTSGTRAHDVFKQKKQCILHV